MSDLVVVALAAEAAYVPEGVEVLVTGLGKTPAAVALTRRLMDSPVDRVLNIGTAGSLRPGVGGLHEVGTVVNHDLNADVIRGLGVDPQERIEWGDGVVLASGDVFVTDPVVRDRLAGFADLVDMEGYALAYVCREIGVPLRMAKHVSDEADESALDWAQAVDASARALGAWVEEVLR